MKAALEASRFQFRRGEGERETSAKDGNLPEYGRFKIRTLPDTDALEELLLGCPGGAGTARLAPND